MKIAFVHDRLLTRGGAEKVFIDLISQTQSTEGKVFTLFSDQDNIQVKQSNYQIVSAVPLSFMKLNLIDYRKLLPIFPFLMKLLSRQIRAYQPDKVIISSFAVAKNIDYDGDKMLYLHSPMQYIWDCYEEYVDKLYGIPRQIFKLIVPFLKKWDLKYTTFQETYFNSQYTAQLAKQIYQMTGTIKYPQLDPLFLEYDHYEENHNYYVYIGRLVKFSKEVDKIIQLFNIIGENLIIIGSGPDELYLKSIAKSNIIFVGYVGDVFERSKILGRSQGLINLTKESFGLVTAEALALGVPVFGYQAGATRELINSSNGYLVNNKQLDNLVQEFQIFQNITYDKIKIRNNFREFYLNYHYN